MSLRHFVVQEENREKGPEGHGQGGVRDLTARWGYQARSNLVPGEYIVNVGQLGNPSMFKYW